MAPGLSVADSGCERTSHTHTQSMGVMSNRHSGCILILISLPILRLLQWGSLLCVPTCLHYGKSYIQNETLLIYWFIHWLILHRWKKWDIVCHSFFLLIAWERTQDCINLHQSVLLEGSISRLMNLSIWICLFSYLSPELWSRLCFVIASSHTSNGD